MISTFILDNGYPVNDNTLPNAFLNIVKLETSTDDDCESLTDFLSGKKFDFNYQEQKTWYTALHYAVQRGLAKTVERLVAHGADVNAVGDKDVLPLNIAMGLSGENSAAIQEILLKNGAKESWRRGVVHEVVNFASRESSSAGAKTENSDAPKNKKVSFSSLMLEPQKIKVVETVAVEPPKLDGLTISDDQEMEDGGAEENVLVTESEDGAFLFSTGC